MNYCGIKKTDIANGPGVRVSLFVSGCRNHCPGCFQPETWDFDYGEPFTAEAENEIITALRPSWIQGFSVLGGDPMEPENQEALLPFLQRLKALFPEKDIWFYTGYAFESLQHSPLFSLIDVVVDGMYMEDERDISLAFRGSRNQRIINVPASLEAGVCVLWEQTDAAKQQKEKLLLQRECRRSSSSMNWPPR